MAIKQQDLVTPGYDNSLGLRNDIEAEFGDVTSTPATSISEYYKGTLEVPDIPLNATIPSIPVGSSPISFSDFYGTQANTPAEGVVELTLGATHIVGNTIEADVSGITDVDGIDNGTWEIQWILTEGTVVTTDSWTAATVDGNGILSVSKTSDYVDQKYKARVRFLDSVSNPEPQGSPGYFESTETTATAATFDPTINLIDTSPDYVGDTLTATFVNNSIFGNNDNTVTYSWVWQRDNGGDNNFTDISGSAGSVDSTFNQNFGGSATYVIDADDIGNQVRIRVTQTIEVDLRNPNPLAEPDITFNLGPVNSNALTPINAPLLNNVFLAAEPESASLVPGVTLRADATNLLDLDGLASLEFNWYKRAIGASVWPGTAFRTSTVDPATTKIDDYTTSTDFASGDVDAEFEVRVTATDSANTPVAETKTSNIIAVNNNTSYSIASNATVREGVAITFNVTVTNPANEGISWAITGDTAALAQISTQTGTVGAGSVTGTFPISITPDISNEYIDNSGAIGNFQLTVTGNNTGASGTSSDVSLLNAFATAQVADIQLTDENGVSVVLGQGNAVPENGIAYVTLTGTNIVGNEQIWAESLTSAFGGNGGIHTQAEIDNGRNAQLGVPTWAWVPGNNQYEASFAVQLIEDTSTVPTDGSTRVRFYVKNNTGNLTTGLQALVSNVTPAVLDLQGGTLSPTIYDNYSQSQITTYSFSFTNTGAEAHGALSLPSDGSASLSGTYIDPWNEFPPPGGYFWKVSGIPSGFSGTAPTTYTQYPSTFDFSYTLTSAATSTDTPSGNITVFAARDAAGTGESSAVYTTTIARQGINEAPIAPNGTATIPYDVLSFLDLKTLASDFETPDLELSYSVSNLQPANSGTIVVDNRSGVSTRGRVSLNPFSSVGENGNDAVLTFNYTIEDAGGLTDTGTVTVTVKGKMAVPESYEVGYELGFSGDVSTNDNLTGRGTVTYAAGGIIQDPLDVFTEFSFNNDGTFTFQANKTGDIGIFGVTQDDTLTFSYTATDQNGFSDSDIATIVVKQRMVDIDDLTATTPYDTTITGTIGDPSGRRTDLSLVSSSLDGGALTLNSDGSYEFNPSANTAEFGEGDVNITFVVRPTDGTITGPDYTMTITVQEEDLVPIPGGSFFIRQSTDPTGGNDSWRVVDSEATDDEQTTSFSSSRVRLYREAVVGPQTTIYRFRFDIAAVAGSSANYKTPGGTQTFMSITDPAQFYIGYHGPSNVDPTAIKLVITGGDDNNADTGWVDVTGQSGPTAGAFLNLDCLAVEGQIGFTTTTTTTNVVEVWGRADGYLDTKLGEFACFMQAVATRTG